MSMNPYDYYENFVSPNCKDFYADESNLRKAFNAVVSVVHMTDNYFNYYKKQGDSRILSYKKMEDLQRYLSTQAKYFNDIQSIANAYKHLYTKSEKAYVNVESGGAITSIQVTDNDVTSIEGLVQDDNSNYIVVYSMKSGARLRLKTALSDVEKLWSGIINP